MFPTNGDDKHPVVLSISFGRSESLDISCKAFPPMSKVHWSIVIFPMQNRSMLWMLWFPLLDSNVFNFRGQLRGLGYSPGASALRLSGEEDQEAFHRWNPMAR